MARTRAGEVMEAMVAMFATGDVTAVEAAVHPDYVDHQGLGGQPVHGSSGFAHVVAVARRGFEALDVTIEDLVEDGDRVAARLRWRGVRGGDGGGGGEVVRETLEIVHVAGGRAVEHWGGRSWMP